MALRKRMAAVTVAGVVALGAGLATAGPAAAIDRVSDSACYNQSDFYEIWNDAQIDGRVCFANNGGTNVGIYNAWKITSGNNTSDTDFYYPGGPGLGVHLPSWQWATFSPTVTVYWINISGR
jgi:hypothetical protein